MAEKSDLLKDVVKAASIFLTDPRQAMSFVMPGQYEFIADRPVTPSKADEAKIGYNILPNLWVAQKSGHRAQLSAVYPLYKDESKANLIVIRQRGDKRNVADIVNAGEAIEGDIYDVLRYIDMALKAGYLEITLDPNTACTLTQINKSIQEGKAVVL